MGILGHVDRLHIARVQAGVVHAGAQGARGGIEILHLLRLMARIAQILRQLHRILERAPRMTAHQVGHQILVEAVLPVDGVVALHKRLVNLPPWLAHAGEHIRADMFMQV